jgi:hypothetical protein
VTHGQPGVVDYVSFPIHERYRHLKSALLLFSTTFITTNRSRMIKSSEIVRTLSKCTDLQKYKCKL